MSAQERRVLAEEGSGRRGSSQRGVFLAEEGSGRRGSWQRRALGEEDPGRELSVHVHLEFTCFIVHSFIHSLCVWHMCTRACKYVCLDTHTLAKQKKTLGPALSPSDLPSLERVSH